MFQMARLHNVMRPLGVGEPRWLADTVNGAIHVMAPDVDGWNALIVGVQLLLGALLLFGRTPRVVWTGLWLSLVWTAVVWLFGEGLGGALTGNATVGPMSRAPLCSTDGSRSRFAIRDHDWRFGRGFNPVRDGPAVFFGLGALQQLAPVFWTSMGLSSPFQSTGSMQPGYMQHTMLGAVALSYQHPVVANLVVTLALDSCPGGSSPVRAAPSISWPGF